MAEERVHYPNTYKSDNWFLTDMTNCATPKLIIMIFVAFMNDVNVTGITNVIRIVLDANKNHWLRNSTFQTLHCQAASGYGDTEDGIDMQE